MKLEKSDLKSNAQGTFDEINIEEGFIVLTSKNETDDIKVLEREIDSSYIQFHFCNKGTAGFLFNQGNYTLNIDEDTSLLLYNPQRDLPIHLELKPHSNAIPKTL